MISQKRFEPTIVLNFLCKWLTMETELLCGRKIHFPDIKTSATFSDDSKKLSWLEIEFCYHLWSPIPSTEICTNIL